MKLLRTAVLVVCLLAAQMTLSQPEGEIEDDSVEEEDWEPMDASPIRNIDDYTPRFVVKLSDGNLFCFAIEGYELFTYNLLTCSYISVNTFINVSQYEDGSWGRGHTDIGFTIKALDSRVKSGKRLFKAVVDGRNKKALMENFGEVDMKKGSVTFSVNQGHSDIESQGANREQFRVILDRPKLDIWAVMSDDRFYTVYVEDASGLFYNNNMAVHGLIGQFLSYKVQINIAQRRLMRQKGSPIPVREGKVWDSVKEKEYQGRTCWYPLDNASAIEGFAYEYIVEHILATSYKFSHFKKY